MSQDTLQYKVLQWAFSFLKKYNREQSNAELLLKHHLQCSDDQFLLSMREPVPYDIMEKFKHDIKQHAIDGVPVQHLMGIAYFYGREFFVNGKVLIPRFDTEVLVQYVINYLKSHFANERLTIVDVGTGSGIIAITLALELPNIQVYATDISNEAIQMAERNARHHEVNVQFFQGDFLDPLITQKIDPMVIISNPPYIKEEDEHMLEDTVKNFDPPLALYGGQSGLIAYEKIMAQSEKLPGHSCRMICFEIGHDQASDVTKLIKSHYKCSEIQVIKDLNHKDRVVFAHILF